jgi:group I intron endonuclease
MRLGKSNPNMNNSYEKYGLNSFIFTIIESCEKSVLIEREKYWADQYKLSGFTLFNCGDFIDNPTRGVKISEDRKKHLRELSLGDKNPSYGKMWVHKKNKQFFIKKHDFQKYEKNGYKAGLSPEHKEKIGKTLKTLNRKMSDDNRKKLIECAKKPKTEIHKLNLSKSKILLCGVKVKCVDTGEVFDSYISAAIKHNTSFQAIRQSIKRNGKCCGLTFIHI